MSTDQEMMMMFSRRGYFHHTTTTHTNTLFILYINSLEYLSRERGVCLSLQKTNAGEQAHQEWTWSHSEVYLEEVKRDTWTFSLPVLQAKSAKALNVLRSSLRMSSNKLLSTKLHSRYKLLQKFEVFVARFHPGVDRKKESNG